MVAGVAPLVSYLLQTGGQTFLGGKELPQDHCYCLIPSLDGEYGDTSENYVRRIIMQAHVSTCMVYSTVTFLQL